MFKLVARMSKFFAAFLMLVYNYFNSPTKLFLNLYLSKFLDNLTKSFFPYKHSQYLFAP